MYLINQGIVLRDFLLEDIPNKIKWINDPDNNTFLHYDLPLIYNKTVEWFNNKNNNYRIDAIIEYNNIPVGLIGLLSIDSSNNKAEFYITIGDKNYKNKGIATTATKMMLEYAFGELSLNKIYLNVDKENLYAIKLYEKVGFVCEGIFKEDLIHNGRYIDRLRYAILNNEYKL